MADLAGKAKKEAADKARAQEIHLRVHGYTVFHFDFKPNLTVRNLSLGDAFRTMKRLAGYKVKFWRCPMRGLAVELFEPPTTKYLYDIGTRSRLLHFSRNPDEIEAKKELVLDLLYCGLGLYRCLPNAVFDEQVRILKGLLTAPPSIDKDEWLALKERLLPHIRPIIDTHQPELRAFLLGKPYQGNQTGPVAVTMTPLQRLD